MAAQFATLRAHTLAAGPSVATRKPTLRQSAPSVRLPTRRGAVVVKAAKAGTQIPDKYTTVTPNGELIFVKCAPPEKETAGGVLLPSASLEKSTSGEVVGAGSGCSQLKEGDTVLYSKFGLGATEVEFKGDNFVLMKEQDCIGALPANGDVDELSPVGERILVKVLKTPSKSTGGVLLTESARDKPMQGMVVKVGPKVEKLAEGDKVVYFQYAGDKMKSRNGEAYIVLRAADVFGKLN